MPGSGYFKSFRSGIVFSKVKLISLNFTKYIFITFGFQINFDVYFFPLTEETICFTWLSGIINSVQSYWRTEPSSYSAFLWLVKYPPLKINVIYRRRGSLRITLFGILQISFHRLCDIWYVQSWCITLSCSISCLNCCWEWFGCLMVVSNELEVILPGVLEVFPSL